MKCIIVEDEPGSINVLKKYIEQIPFLILAETFRQPVKALSFLKDNIVDLVFLDINMPGLSGMELIKILPNNPAVIFTTAYAEFAAESYEYNAVDYLVKPIQFDRFLKAVMKVENEVPNETAKHNESAKKFAVLRSGAVVHKVPLDEILFVEKKDNYMEFQTIDKKILVRGNMSDVFDLIPEDLFCRVHKSFVVAIAHVHAIEVHQLHVKEYIIPLGETFRPIALERLTGK